jgi:hypothetical protein
MERIFFSVLIISIALTGVCGRSAATDPGFESRKGMEAGASGNIAPGHDGTNVYAITSEEIPEKKQDEQSESDNLLSGVQVCELTPELRTILELPQDVEGVLVIGVSEESPAVDLLLEGDVIVEIDRIPVKDLKGYNRMTSGLQPRESPLFLLYRDGGYFYTTPEQLDSP